MSTQTDTDTTSTVDATMKLLEELETLRHVNDALGGPSFIDKIHWEQSGYKYLVEAGFVEWGDPPKGFDAERFAGTMITEKGRKALKLAQKTKRD